MDNDRETFAASLSKAARSSLRYGLRMSVGRYQTATRLRLGPRTRSQPFFLSSVIRIKNEARFLPELLAHHRLLGVEHFYLYDNNSTDDVAAVLQPFVEAGLATIIPWPTVPASPSCYIDFFNRYAADSEWVAFLDADEFLVEQSEGLLLDFLKSHPTWPALAVNWTYFGSSLHERIPNGLVMSNFQLANAQMSSHVKVIARPDQVVAYYNSHNFIYRALGVSRDVNGAPALGSVLAWPHPGSQPIRINHYVYRSREDYMAKASGSYVDAEGARSSARREAFAEPEFRHHIAATNSFAAEAYAERVEGFLHGLGYGQPYVSTDPVAT